MTKKCQKGHFKPVIMAHYTLSIMKRNSQWDKKKITSRNTECLRLERGRRGYKHWLLLQRTQACLTAPRWQPRTSYNSSSKRCDSLGMHVVAEACTEENIHTYKTKFNLKEITEQWAEREDFKSSNKNNSQQRNRNH